jgi:hypothetical protein
VGGEGEPRSGVRRVAAELSVNEETERTRLNPLDRAARRAEFAANASAASVLDVVTSDDEA